MRVLYVVNNAAFFVSHRAPIALAARARGHEVALVTGQGGSATLEADAVRSLSEHRIPHQVTSFSSTGINPLVELRGLWRLVREMRRWRPTVVHCASPKGLLYGGIAARVVGARGLVLAVSGMGFLFTGTGRGVRGLLRGAYSILIRWVYSHPNKRVIVQNRDDEGLIVDAGLARRSQMVLIPGSGVPLERYLALPDEPREELVVLPARLLKDKGVVEFVEAAARLRADGITWRFVLAGTADYRNPTAIDEAQILAWQRDGIIDWWGHCPDMLSVYGRAAIVCLPSYREGMPKSLLEAAAAGCAVVTTDTIGCREAVLPGVSGDLVPVCDAAALADALRALIADPQRRRRYGEAGRKLAIERFGLDAVIERTLRIYDELEGKR